MANITFQGDAKSTRIPTAATGTNATSDGQNTTAHRQRFLGITLTGGSDAAKAIVYDAQSAAGTPIVTVSTVANTTANVLIPAQGKVISTNIFTAVTGTLSEATVYWN